MEAELNRLDILLVFARLLHEALFAASAFTFYSEVSPYNALFERQPAMLPDLPAWTTSSRRKHRIILVSRRYAGYVAITQATALAKNNRALRTKTTITGQHHYDEGDLVDYHRLTTAKDDWGGWNGPFPVVKNDPETGQVIIRVGNRDVQ
eukprot:1067978-Pyramimonas_sp.AAC.1